MKITVINGTEIKGCTYHIKESFLSVLREGNDISEFYLPRDLPHFCCGCKNCFFKGEELCPHADFTMPIWKAILEADLLVFTSPVYALRVSGQMKALLDHLCCHWIVHRPEREMITKRSVILTNSIGASNRAAQKEIKDSLNWMGVSSVKCLGFGLMEGIIWDELSETRRSKITGKTIALANKFKSISPAHRSLKTRAFFVISRFLHKSVLKNESTPSADNQHWIDKGWIKQS